MDKLQNATPLFSLLTPVGTGVLNRNRTTHRKVQHVFFEYGCVTQGDTAQQDEDGRDLHRLHGEGME